MTAVAGSGIHITLMYTLRTMDLPGCFQRVARLHLHVHVSLISMMKNVLG